MKRTQRDTETSVGIITRRAAVLGGVQLGVAGLLGWRMRQMQVEQADEFRLLAEENRINMRLVAPPRGLIFDRNGIPLAENSQNYRIVIVKEDAGDVEDVLSRLQQLIYIDADEMERARKEIARRSPFVPVTITDQRQWEDVATVAVNAPALPGITPDVGLTRQYPLGADHAHVVGYVGPVSDYDLSRIDDDDPLLQIPKFQIGKTGVEQKTERALRGKAGARRIEVNAAGRVMRELDRDDGTPGADLQLTVESKLQNFAEARLAIGLSAAAVVMDVRTGDLLSVGNAPTFDPNKFVRGISVADYGELTGNIYRPLANKAVQGAYPPGSTFKMLVSLAALEAGLLSSDETVYCGGYTELGNRRFHCWKRGGHGRMNLEKSLQQSCDVFYYEMAQRVGIDRIAETARKFGIGEDFDLPMSAVTSGVMPDKAWLRQRYDQEWRVGDSLNASIGQGYVLSSPLQLAVMTARIASGTKIQPRLVKSIDSVETPVVGAEPLGLNENHLRLIRKGMFAVSNTNRGTAFRSRIAADGMAMAGKTGTSQVRSAVVNNSQVPWEQRDHALFVGYAPYDNPRYAISVVVEHGGGGSTAAAPIARDIMLFALHGELPPMESYPSGVRREVESLFAELDLRSDFRPTRDGKNRA
ncbi:Stage V sporulation protein D [Rhodobacteraceae bacterium THAF1]|uniref:penicillin-binding protein 2 n=1 Tax=Palleronia sp. THAF1 TaxID=2587842 RepID=UPI000F4178B8|nr:penicillin-binding protein 2 [Palleronia sp. THAF1]QFU08693.1 Stage V sporulation protein D [Palleronia sp. THAF1]VDC28440.1 Stage V sporulation protein D [Rhodobacteraceae bacterium THAF1]